MILPPPSKHTSILIVGGGLTGLALADMLVTAGRDVRVIEARNRLGGRILTKEIDGAAFDMGPAWIWPGQPRIAALAERLGLTIFEQHSKGRLVFQAADGSIRRDLDMAPMAGSLRIAGGLQGLVDGLAARIGPDRIQTGRRLTGIAASGQQIAAELADGDRLLADQVVLAAPPRLLEASFDFTPHLPTQAKATMRAIPTWMAGHAKVMAVYDRPFWREAGLNGDAISHLGPLAEIHDASSADGSLGALFGFVGVPAAQRVDQQALLTAAAQQLGALFGPEAAAPRALHLEDWARDQLTATEDDKTPPASHPDYRPLPSLQGLWGGRLHITSSELAPAFGGFIEGALEAAAATASALTN
ncbi:MAG: FAD-dependent oxidoreductase [Pseudomonadota bacterium]